MPTRSLRSLTLVILVVGVVLAGCSPGTLRNQVQRYLFQSEAPTATAPDSPANRLLVQGDDGNLYVVRPDGSERFALTTDASATRLYTQPVWSPDGTQIAWSWLDDERSFLLTSRFDGTERRKLEVPFLPFYIAWSPSGAQLAYLSNWQDVDKPSIALRLVNVEPDGNTVQTLAAGQPFYFSWSPDGQRLLTHIDNERVELQSVDGSQRAVAMPSGFFQAPQWSADGSHLIFGAGSDTGQRLVVADEQGNSLSEVTDFDGRITFTESPDGRQLAYVVTDAANRAGTLGPLYTVEPGTLRTRELTERPVLAFFWSPDSRKLAYLTLGEIRGRLAMRWHIWDGKRTEPYAAFFPTATFLDTFLPFFDQYAQSHNLWSPDSEAFVFAGTLADGRRGVWVQALGRDRAPTSAGPGQAAIWSSR